MSILSRDIGIYASIIEPKQGVLASQFLLTHHILIRGCFIDAIFKSTGMIPVRRVWYAMRGCNAQEVFLHLEVLRPLVFRGLIAGGVNES
jgi:hypothetical protein